MYPYTNTLKGWFYKTVISAIAILFLVLPLVS